MKSMAPTRESKGASVRIVDSRSFPVSKQIAAALVTIKPGGLRELHWHPNGSEWQFWITGQRPHDGILPGRQRANDGFQCQ